MIVGQEAEAQLHEAVNDARFPHRVAARRALKFRQTGDVADLVAVLDDQEHVSSDDASDYPHPCPTTQSLFALGGTERFWLHLVPMPVDLAARAADRFAGDVAEGESLGRLHLPTAELPSAVAAAQRILHASGMDTRVFPEPDIRRAVRPVQRQVWRYDGGTAVPAAPMPSAEAVRLLHEASDDSWASPLDGLMKTRQLAALDLDDLLGLLVHSPEPPNTRRWHFVGRESPSFWYRFLQPLVCLGIVQNTRGEWSP